MLCLEMLPWRRGSGNGLARRKEGPVVVVAVSWLSVLVRAGGLTGLMSWSLYSVETGLASVARISSLRVGLRNAGWVSSRDKGVVMAECRCSLLGAGLRNVLRLSSPVGTGL